MKQVEKSNVLLIYTDQQRYDSLKCYRNTIARTPNIDRLATEGVLFEHNFVQNPVCMPSRMSLLTSQYPGSLGIGTNGISMPKGPLLVHEVIKPYGYQTANIGKLHFTPHANRHHKNPHDSYGFDTFILSDESGCYDDAYIQWVKEKDEKALEKVYTSLPPEAHKYGQNEYATRPRETHEPYVFEGEDDLTHSAFVAEEIMHHIPLLTRPRNTLICTI